MQQGSSSASLAVVELQGPSSTGFAVLFDVLDDFSREGLGIEVDLSLPSGRVIRALEQIIKWRAIHAAIRRENG